MEVYFIGVGEACDANHGNTSIHVKTVNDVSILCDCGFSAAHSYFAFCNESDQLDMVWVSHFHGDHFFGIPLLLLRLWEMKRTKPLLVIGQKGTEDKIKEAMDLAYPGFRGKLKYELCFREIEPGSVHEISDLQVQSVQTDHSQRNLGLLIHDGKNKFYYSGDGRPTADVAALIQGCDMAVHEAFRLTEEINHHGSITGCLNLARSCNIRKMALVHLERNFRQNQTNEINNLLDENPILKLPVSGDHINL